jgi:hypothetical protein
MADRTAFFQQRAYSNGQRQTHYLERRAEVPLQATTFIG